MDVSSVTLGEKHPLYVWVRCAQDASGVKQQNVQCGWCRHVRVLAVGGNDRVQTASDTWLFFEHQMLVLSVRWLPAVSPVPTSFAQ